MIPIPVVAARLRLGAERYGEGSGMDGNRAHRPGRVASLATYGQKSGPLRSTDPKLERVPRGGFTTYRAEFHDAK